MLRRAIRSAGAVVLRAVSRVRLRAIDGGPGPMLVLVPTGPGVFVNVSVATGVHVTTGGLPGETVGPIRRGADGLATSRALNGSDRAIRVRNMPG